MVLVGAHGTFNETAAVGAGLIRVDQHEAVSAGDTTHPMIYSLDIIKE